MPNIHNVISDVQEKVTADHFPITASVWGVEGEWTVVQFKCANNPERNFLNVEVHIENQVSCVLEQVGFTNDQRDTIMEIFVWLLTEEYDKMQAMPHPHNVLDLLKQNVDEKLGDFGISMDWYQSEHCDKTFTVILRRGNTDIKLNVLFKPDSYSITAGENCSDALMSVMIDKLNQCIYY